MPFLTEGLLDEPIVPLQLGALTYFLPYIGYYVLGWATWSAPPRRRVAWWLLLVAVPLLIASTVWAYASPVTEIPPGKVLLPTYLAPTRRRDRKSTRLNSSHVATSYAVFCLKKK